MLYYIHLVKSGFIRELDGDLTFIGVPAEEVIEQDFRKQLREEGFRVESLARIASMSQAEGIKFVD